MTADSEPTTIFPQPEGPFPQAFGRYQLLKKLGRGGMGTVYLAHDSRLDIEVALKIPNPDLLDDEDFLQRFHDEARSAARLCHPNLCHIFDVGEFADIHYLSLRYVPGAPLQTSARWKVSEAVRLIHRLAQAMYHAHRLGVVHRDLKPANILVTPEGEPVITDFGVALRLHTGETRRTEAGIAIGTLPYMAPEQALPAPELIGPGVDIWALGVILYLLLTQEKPFTGAERREIRKRILEATFPPATSHRPDLPPRLDEVFRSIFGRRPEDRPASMLELARLLEEFLDPQPGGTAGANEPTPPPGEMDASTSRRPPRIARAAVRFLFVGMGERALASPRSDRLYLDVGNDLRAGVIDHHQRTALHGSTTSLVLDHPHLLEGSIRPGRQLEDPFTIVVHEQPDLDAVSSTFLALHYLQTGSFPPGAEGLARYLDRVDEGSLGLTLAQPHALYPAYLVLNNRLGRQRWNVPQERWRTTVEVGLELLGFVLDHATLDELPLPEVDAFACPGLFQPEDRAEITADIERYQRKLAAPHCHARRGKLRLPSKFGGRTTVDALLVRDVQNTADPERVIFFKDWARSDNRQAPSGQGFAALSVFHSEGGPQRRRCIISVTPASGATLRGLGDLLDLAESGKRQAIHGVDDRTSDPISGQSRPPRPGYPNADPWYDGRAHAYTIIDSPREGTLLTAEEIEDIFWQFGNGGALEALAPPATP